MQLTVVKTFLYTVIAPHLKMANIKHLITISCSANTIYRALTTKKGIQGWWTPDTVIEPAVDSIAEFTFGERYHNKMIIKDLQPDRRVEWECIEGDKEWIGTVFIFDLEDNDGKTILRFSQNNWREATDFYAYCNFQWGQYMVSLKHYCETGKGSPFDPNNFE